MRKVRRIRREGQGTAVIAADFNALPVDAAAIDSKVAVIQALNYKPGSSVSSLDGQRSDLLRLTDGERE